MRWTPVVLLVAVAAPSAQPAGAWREAPEFLPLFAPAGARGAAYRAYVSPADLDAVLRGLAADPALLRVPGAWRPLPLLPADAFGQTGRYDRGRLLRLYGATRARVARGACLQNGRVREAWTLISPHPDPELRRLERGTLLLVLRYDGPKDGCDLLHR
ncbi:MAG: hypothetical protein HYY76_06325 [Acidobacteria bacterium]|nr:hypothetical protein [Acidobacteriota bacterium]